MEHCTVHSWKTSSFSPSKLAEPTRLKVCFSILHHYSLIHSPSLIIPTIRSFLPLLPKPIPTNHPFVVATIIISLEIVITISYSLVPRPLPPEKRPGDEVKSLIDCRTPIAFKLGLKHLCSNLLCSCHTLVCSFVCFPFIYLCIHLSCIV